MRGGRVVAARAFGEGWSLLITDTAPGRPVDRLCESHWRAAAQPWTASPCNPDGRADRAHSRTALADTHQFARSAVSTTPSRCQAATTCGPARSERGPVTRRLLGPVTGGAALSREMRNTIVPVKGGAAGRRGGPTVEIVGPVRAIDRVQPPDSSDCCSLKGNHQEPKSSNKSKMSPVTRSNVDPRGALAGQLGQRTRRSRSTAP